MSDIIPGHVYGDTAPLWTVNAQNLNALVGSAVIDEEFISARTEKDPLVLSDKFPITDGVLQYATMQTLKDLIIPVGTILQRQIVISNATDSTTASIPADNTKPQITEGAQFFTLSITPQYNNSIIRLRLLAHIAHNFAGEMNICCSLYRDSVADPLASGIVAPGSPASVGQISVDIDDTPNTLLAVTYSMRFGKVTPTAATAYINRSGSSVFFGGALTTSLEATEIKQ